MKLGKVVLTLCILLFGTCFAAAQATPTAARALQVSAFGGLTGVYTGLNGGRNLSITAGGDLGIRSYYRLYPFFEVRGTYPINKGQIAGAKNILVGIKVAKIYDRFTPYGDILVGLGQLNYKNLTPNPAGTFAYNYSSSTVFSPGAGLDFRIADKYSIKVDGQLQHYSVPVVPSGHIWTKAVTVGVVYRFFSDSTPR